MSVIGPAEYIDEFRREAQAILDHADEAAEHYAKGEPASAALVIGVVHYKFAAAESAASAAMDAIKRVDGVTPDDALRARD